MPEPGDVYAWPAHEGRACGDETCNGLHLVKVLADDDHPDIGPLTRHFTTAEVPDGCAG
jgi:hypothetical protein